MAIRHLHLLALTLALAFAGCADKADPAPESSSDGSSSTPAMPALSGGALAAAQAMDANATVQAETIHLQGTTATGVCGYAWTPVVGTGRCHYQDGDNAWLELEGSPLALAGTLTWAADTPATEELNVYVLYLRDGSYWFDEDTPAATGTSPLAFDFDLSAYSETGVALGVSSTRGQGAPVGYVAYSTPQDFVLDATYFSIVSA